LKIPPLGANAPTADSQRQLTTQSRAERVRSEHAAELTGLDLTQPPPANRSDSEAPWRSPGWIAAVIGGAALLATGLFLILRGGASKPNDREIALVSSNDREDVHADNSDEKSNVFRPQIKSDQHEQPDLTSSNSDASNPATATYKGVGQQREKPTAKDSSAPFALSDFGVHVPTRASVIEIDGVALPIHNLQELTGQRDVALVLPLGKHVVRFEKSDPPRLLEPKRWFLDAYRDAMTRVQTNGRWDFDRLLDLSRSSLDRFTEPLVPHFWGNYYWQENEIDAAARQYTWALEIAPTFAPAYFNLAALYHERGNDIAAQRYLRLADLWNAQNAYGLAQALAALHAAVGNPDPSSGVVNDESDWYVGTQDELTVRDRDMVAVLQSSAEFAPRITERAKILNNLGAYIEHVGKPEHALQSYRSAAAVLGAAPVSAEERRVIQGILVNLARVCRKADMPEYRRYERLQAMIH